MLRKAKPMGRLLRQKLMALVACPSSNQTRLALMRPNPPRLRISKPYLL